jgi:hypothetical protein
MDKLTNFKLLPYIVGLVTDSDLSAIYHRLSDEGSLIKLFYDGSVRTEVEFINHIKNPLNEVYFIVLDCQLVGLVWLNNHEQRRAQIHFCLFKIVWGRKSVLVAKLALKNLLTTKVDGEYSLDMLVGFTPTHNKLACRLVKLCGMKTLGELPGCVIDYYDGTVSNGLITYLTREELENG